MSPRELLKVGGWFSLASSIGLLVAGLWIVAMLPARVVSEPFGQAARVAAMILIGSAFGAAVAGGLATLFGMEWK